MLVVALMGTSRGRVGRLLFVCLLTGCGGSKTGVNPDAGAGGSGGGGTSGAGGTAGGGGGGVAGQDGGAPDSGDAGVTPTIVATLDGNPGSLAADGTNLYVTILSTPGHFDGKVEKVQKTAVGATGSAITTLASGLREPNTIAVDGVSVYFRDTETAFPNNPSVFSVPVAGGTVTETAQSNTTTYTKLAIANSVLYSVTGNTGTVSSFPLTAGTTSAGQVIYASTGLVGIDSDGTSVFLLLYPPGGVPDEVHIYKIPVAGGASADLVRLVGGTSPGDDFLVDDATKIYWSDQGTGGVYAIPKTGGVATPTPLATFPVSGCLAPQIALDGNDVYVLTPQTLSRLPKAGGTPVTLASASSSAQSDSYIVCGNNANAVALAVDASYVYWLHESHAQILKLAK